MKPSLSTFSWKRSISLRQSEARLAEKKSASGDNPWRGCSQVGTGLITRLKPVEMREQLRRCHAVKCNVLCCSSILKLFFMTTQLLCASTDVMLFSQVSQILCFFDLETTACSQVMVWSRSSETSKTFLTSYRGICKIFSTGFTVNPPALRSHHILIASHHMSSYCKFRDIDSAIERCHIVSIAKLSTSGHLLKCQYDSSQPIAQRKERVPELCFLSAFWAPLNSAGSMKSLASLQFWCHGTFF